MSVQRHCKEYEASVQAGKNFPTSPPRHSLVGGIVGIADAIDRTDRIEGRHRGELPADIADVAVDRAIEDIGIIGKGEVQQAFARKDLPRSGGQR